MKTCTHCGQQLVLSPGAAERAEHFGETPAFYNAIFTMHADCQLAKRRADTSELMQRLRTPVLDLTYA